MKSVHLKSLLASPPISTLKMTHFAQTRFRSPWSNGQEERSYTAQSLPSQIHTSLNIFRSKSWNFLFPRQLESHMSGALLPCGILTLHTHCSKCSASPHLCGQKDSFTLTAINSLILFSTEGLHVFHLTDS